MSEFDGLLKIRRTWPKVSRQLPVSLAITAICQHTLRPKARLSLNHSIVEHILTFSDLLGHITMLTL